MSKINCEICGTVYPDNATACPICGTARPSGEKKETPAEAQEKAVERVKGGRFSHRNVKKRKKAAQKAELASKRQAPKTTEESAPAGEKKGDGKGLKTVVAILLVAVLLVGVYIGIRFWQGRNAYDDAENETTQNTSDTSDTTEPADVACTDIIINDLDMARGIEFQGEGRAWRLSVTTVPEDTTDLMTITSSNESVAKVVVTSEHIEIVAVGPGTADITVSCGNVSKVFPVNCVFETEATTEATEETEETTEPTTETTEPASGFQLNRSDITFSHEGESFTFSPGTGISVAQVTWASEDESIVTISASGKATAVGEGTTYITATYNGETQRCIIRCSFPEETEPTGEPDPTETTGGDSDEWYINYEDVTIDVGESFTLRIRNDAGDVASVSWSVSTSGVVSIDGNTVTGAASGVTTISATYNGVTYKCIVRVR